MRFYPKQKIIHTKPNLEITMNTEIETKIEALLINDNKKVVKALVGFLNKYVNPSFGTIPKREVDLMVFKLLKDLNIIKDNPTVYEVVKTLKISTAKARGLIYDLEIRMLNDEQLRKKAQDFLSKPLFRKDGDYILFDIDNPVVMDYIKDQVKKKNIFSDGSFSPTIIKIPISGFSTLYSEFLTSDEIKILDQRLKEIGGKDYSFDKLLTDLIKAAANNLLPGIGGAITGALVDYLSPIVTSNYAVFANRIRNIYSIIKD